MKTYTPEELKVILEQHKLWLESKGKEGERADLRGADLRGASLSNADLRLAELSNANFSCANFSCANYKGAYYRKAAPPIGLPDGVRVFY